MQGFKDSKGKLPLHTVFTKQFPKALIEIAKRSEYGHQKYIKYDEDYMNFKRIPNAKQEYANARMRHNMCLGEDSETYLDHLIAATWCGLAEIELILDEAKFKYSNLEDSTQKEKLDKSYDFVEELSKVVNNSTPVEIPFVELTKDEFIEKYKPLTNNKGSIKIFSNLTEVNKHFGEYTVWGNIIKNTYWSLTQCPYDEMFIYPGNHSCNNIGYVITEKEWEHENIQVDYNQNVPIIEAIRDAETCVKTRGYRMNIIDLVFTILNIIDDCDKDKGYISIPRLYHATVDYIESIYYEDLEDDVLDEIRLYYYE